MKERINEVISSYGLKPRKSLKLIPSKDYEPGYLSTKVGGLPFLLTENSIPKKAGEYLKLALQVNFSELPHLDSYPEDGILQFWIGDMNRSNFEVYDLVYYSKADLSKGLSEEEAGKIYLDPDDTAGLYPMMGSFALEPGDIEEEYMTNYVFDILDEDYLDDEEVFNYFLDQLRGTKIGGYPFTYKCQECETTCPLPEDYKSLLVQIDSMEGNGGGLMWGNLGIGHVSLDKENLEDLDFSDAYFYWDQEMDFEEGLDF